MPRNTRRQLVGKRQEDAAIYEREALLKRLVRELHKPTRRKKVLRTNAELK
jgi:hypothetical protein